MSGSVVLHEGLELILQKKKARLEKPGFGWYDKIDKTVVEYNK